MPCPRRLNSGRSGVEPEGSESLWPPATPRGPPERPGPIPPLMKANPRALATSSRRSGNAQPRTTQRPQGGVWPPILVVFWGDGRKSYRST